MVQKLDESSEQLLFALFAMRLGLASPDQVEGVVRSWLENPDQGIHDLLIHRGAINDHQVEIIQAMVNGFAAGEESGGTLEVTEPEAPWAEGEEPWRLTAPVLLGDVDETLVPDEPPRGADGEDPTRLVPLETPGNYRRKSVLGFGGQARVMLAYDRFLGREVALKELLEDDRRSRAETQRKSRFDRRVWLSRFLREAKITGQLEHPNIVPVYELRRREDGSVFYTMRRVRGVTLADKLAECPDLPARMKLLGHFLDVCNAIAFAHNRGVIHRDIKPENVMVGEFGETVLLDWGVAKAQGVDDVRGREMVREIKLMEAGALGHTRAGMALGTPAYMSPEQARAEYDRIDERSDIWGLGAMLYMILTGEPPYTGVNPVEIIIRVRTEPVKPVMQLCPDAPPDLAAVAEKALQRKKAQRYQSAKDLAEDVSAYMTGGRVEAYSYSAWELLKRFARNNRRVFALAVSLLVTIIVSLVVVSVSYRNESLARENAVDARKQEEAARQQERKERLKANYHLAQAYAKEARHMLDARMLLSGRIYAAASLIYNPASPSSPFYDKGFSSEAPESEMLRVEAASQIYQTDHRVVTALERVHHLDEAVAEVAFSPDGRHLAAGDYGGWLTVWDVQDGSQVMRVRGQDDRVHGLAFSPDSRFVATGGRDRTVKVWKLGEPEPVLVTRPVGGAVDGVAFSPDGQRIAAGSQDHAAYVWEVASGRQVARLARHEDTVFGVAFSPDGQRLATGSWDKTVSVWNWRTGTRLLHLKGHTDSVNRVRFSSDGSRLVTASWDTTVRFWDSRDGHLIHSMETHTEAIHQASFSPDEAWLATCSSDRTIRLWDLQTRRLMEAVECHQDRVNSVVFSPDGSLIASASHDRSVRVFRISARQRVTRLEHEDWVYGVDFSPDGKLAATGGWDTTVRLWNARDGRLLRVMREHPKGLFSVQFSSDSRRLASVGYGGVAVLWDALSGSKLHTFRGHEGGIYGLSVSPDGSLVATGGKDRTLRLWDTRSGKQLAQLGNREGWIYGIDFSPDGSTLAAGSTDNKLRIWNVKSGGLLKTLEGHKDWVSGVDFSSDGSLLVTSGKDGVVILWNVERAQEIRRFTGHKQWVNMVRFSHDDKLIASAGDDRMVMVWSVRTGKPMIQISASTSVTRVAFSADDRHLAVTDHKTAILYPLDFTYTQVDPRELLAGAERVAGLQLTGFGVSVVGRH